LTGDARQPLFWVIPSRSIDLSIYLSIYISMFVRIIFVSANRRATA